MRLLIGVNLLFLGAIVICWQTPQPPVAPPPDRTLAYQNDSYRRENLRLRVELLTMAAEFAKQEEQVRDLRVGLDSLRRVLTKLELPDVPPEERIPPQNLPIRP